MGRRSQHSPEELRELILSAARRVVEEDGISQPSAREIARVIGYAPGTLYNMFHNLDEILLHVEARIFAEMDAKLEASTSGYKGRDAILKFADAFVGFSRDHPRLWALVLQHHTPPDETSPDWYLDKAFAPLTRLERLFASTFGSTNPEENTRRARLMWTSLQGLVQVGSTSKFGVLSHATIASMAQELTLRFLANNSVDAKNRMDAA